MREEVVATIGILSLWRGLGALISKKSHIASLPLQGVK
jgi:hypothetical protein